MQKVVYAKLNNCLISSQKVRLVADLIRGKSCTQAKDILTYTNKSAAKDVLKTLNSAIANCVHNENLDKNSLIVSKVCVDQATTYKRGRATARGRYHQILKRNSNITIGLSSTDNTEKTVKTEKTGKESVKEAKTEDKGKSEKIKKVAKKSTKNLSKKVIKK
jgi:large subunit ribosomal protein L22